MAVIAATCDFTNSFLTRSLRFNFVTPIAAPGFFLAFLISSTVLLAVSCMLILLPNLTWRGRGGWVGIPVKDYISPGVMFTLCIIHFLKGAPAAHRGRRFERGNADGEARQLWMETGAAAEASASSPFSSSDPAQRHRRLPSLVRTIQNCISP